MTDAEMFFLLPCLVLEIVHPILNAGLFLHSFVDVSSRS